MFVIALLGFTSIKAQDFAEEHERLLALSEEFQLVAEPTLKFARILLEEHRDFEYKNLNEVVNSFEHDLTDAYSTELFRFEQLWDAITEDISNCTQVTSNDLRDIYNEMRASGSNTLNGYTEILYGMMTTALSNIERDYQIKLAEVGDLLISLEVSAEELAQVI